MLVVLANNLPDAVRGRMKLWFLEPRPNVFVSGIKDSVAESVIEDLGRYCRIDSGLLLVRSMNRPPWFEMRYLGVPRKPIIELFGLQLIVEAIETTKTIDKP